MREANNFCFSSFFKIFTNVFWLANKQPAPWTTFAVAQLHLRTLIKIWKAHNGLIVHSQLVWKFFSHFLHQHINRPSKIKPFFYGVVNHRISLLSVTYLRVIRWCHVTQLLLSFHCKIRSAESTVNINMYSELQAAVSPGLLRLQLAEEVKFEVCLLLQHLLDLELRHRVEAVVSFSTLVVENMQQVCFSAENKTRSFAFPSQVLRRVIPMMFFVFLFSLSLSLSHSLTYEAASVSSKASSKSCKCMRLFTAYILPARTSPVVGERIYWLDYTKETTTTAVMF